MVILDTCAVIELCLAKPGLKPTTLKKIEDGAVVLSVSFAEIALKIKKGALELNVSARDIFDQFSEVPSIQIESTDVEGWFGAIDLDWHHKDPADRLIVAYAQSRKSPIITSDKLIRKFYKNVMW